MTFDFQLRPVGGQRTFGPCYWINYGSRTLLRNHELGQGKSFQSFKEPARLFTRFVSGRFIGLCEKNLKLKIQNRRDIFVIARADFKLLAQTVAAPAPTKTNR